MTGVLREGAEKGWKNYDDLSPGMDTNRLPNTDDWSGKKLNVILENDAVLSLFFGGETVKWSYCGETGDDPYEEVFIARCVYFIDIFFSGKGNESLSLVFNSSTGRVIAVRSTILDHLPPGDTRVAQEFLVGGIEGVDLAGEIPALTRDLIGYRSINIYSSNHTYEHFYVNSKRYAWQCLEGVQKGQGDMDYATYYKLEENMYLFCFREKIIPVASVFFFDFNKGTNTGKFLGLTSEGKVCNAGTGAFIQKTSFNCYPTGIKPV
ncbi:MAG: molybdenum cofactor biosynthesis F family protein [Clostridiales bacterium]|nr:molybdenum cofactor biosynthesis F family protein [Clostridiales bacterium]